jgi:hypothetical protein
VYRFRQFVYGLTARLDKEDTQEAARLLMPAQYRLFRQMAPNDQRHSIKVCYTLRQAGEDHPDLLSAALLHDAGKSAGRVWLWQRSLIVVLQRWFPGLLAWLARGVDHHAAPWWRRGFVVHRLHPELGAHWACEAGCSPTTVALIRRHQEPIETINCDEDRLLALLQRADEVN